MMPTPSAKPSVLSPWDRPNRESAYGRDNAKQRAAGSEAGAAKEKSMPRSASARRDLPVTDEAIVAEYIVSHRDELSDQMDWFGDKRQSLPEAIRRVAAALNRRDKRLSHQWRLSGGVLAESARRLHLAREKLRGAKNFEELHGIVDLTIGPIPGVGPLYVYDTALRLGSYLDAMPDRVHLHAGARLGARTMLGPGRSRGPSLSLSEMPKPYRELRAFEVENLLCCYHKRLASRQSAAAPPSLVVGGRPRSTHR